MVPVEALPMPMKTPVQLPHISRLQEVFELDPKIPQGLRWKIKASRNTIIGSPAGRKHLNGYWEVRIDGVLYKTSRIVYKLYNNGECPGLYEVDHFDRNKDNNNGENLVLATRPEQARNKRVTSISGYRNVYFDKQLRRGKAPWVATVTITKRSKFLGYFVNPYEGAVAAVAYKREQGLRYEYAPGGTK